MHSGHRLVRYHVGLDVVDLHRIAQRFGELAHRRLLMLLVHEAESLALAQP
ncbi:MAG: hypothetical protein LBD58_11035 [Treponema sp.]|nr:hypothetical protein [Treponema sp.]